MKTAAKVFIIIGMVLMFYFIVPIIIGILAIKKLDTATSKSDLTALGILTLLFCNTIGGILMLCISDEELKANKKVVAEKKVLSNDFEIIGEFPNE